MDKKAGVQISRKAFLKSLLLLFVLMIMAGVLTRTVPAGQYLRLTQEGRTVIDPGSFEFTGRPDYPIWRWFTAPIEVLWQAENSLTIIVTLGFILMVGAALAVLEKTGILQAAFAGIASIFGTQKYLLVLIISLFLILMGAIFDIFEDVSLLVPIILTLSHSLGWDALVGLGMSILAVNLGFSAAITNLLTIDTAQQIAGLPALSETSLRIFIFLSVYIVFAIFIALYAKRVGKTTLFSRRRENEGDLRRRPPRGKPGKLTIQNPEIKRGKAWLLVFLLVILMVSFTGRFILNISDFTLLLVGILFLAAGVGAGLLSGQGSKRVWQAAGEGAISIAPGIPLILMAASIKYIAESGRIMDTILHSASGSLSQISPFMGSILIYFLVLGIEIFIPSASTKAFLLMPIVFPLADIAGVTRKIVIIAHCFGAGCLLLRSWLLKHSNQRQTRAVDHPEIHGVRFPPMTALDMPFGDLGSAHSAHFSGERSENWLQVILGANHAITVSTKSRGALP